MSPKYFIDKNGRGFVFQGGVASESLFEAFTQFLAPLHRLVEIDVLVIGRRWQRIGFNFGCGLIKGSGSASQPRSVQQVVGATVDSIPILIPIQLLKRFPGIYFKVSVNGVFRISVTPNSLRSFPKISCGLCLI